MLRLPKFEVRTPTTLDEAVALLAEFGANARVVAGGTDLLPNLKHELLSPRVLVSLARIDALHGIGDAGAGWLRIGATTSLADVAASERVRAHAPALAQAVEVPDALARVAPDVVVVPLELVEFLDHREGDDDVVLLEDEERVGVVQEHVRVENEVLDARVALLAAGAGGRLGRSRRGAGTLGVGGRR